MERGGFDFSLLFVSHSLLEIANKNESEMHLNAKAKN